MRDSVRESVAALESVRLVLRDFDASAIGVDAADLEASLLPDFEGVKLPNGVAEAIADGNAFSCPVSRRAMTPRAPS